MTIMYRSIVQLRYSVINSFIYFSHTSVDDTKNKSVKKSETHSSLSKQMGIKCSINN